ncbi:MAG: HTH-type transcriptional repressor AseR [Promethearchaeota archaeon]|nr:MAG: HTH-type transcriptional repressor AseR [Candidatus Lokiarchaeota archaeon]
MNVNEYFEELQRFGEDITNQQEFSALLSFCSSLANEERLKIIKSLKKKEYCVCELEAILNKAQSTISHHLRELEKVGLIKGWRKGKFTHYQLIPEEINRYLKVLSNELDLRSD